MKKILLALAAMAALAATPAAAQPPIAPGLTRGTLSASDFVNTDDTYYDGYILVGRKGEKVVLTMDSHAFAVRLQVAFLDGPVSRELIRESSSDAGENVRIELELPHDGTYLIRAGSTRLATGDYTLALGGTRAERDEGTYEIPFVPPARPPLKLQGTLAVGEPATGRLAGEGENIHVYRYVGQDSERLVITVRSDAFPPSVSMGIPWRDGSSVTTIARDLNPSGGPEARIAYRVGFTGEHRIVVSAPPAATGAYRVEVRRAPPAGN